MLSQEANYTAAFMVREKINHFCPLFRCYFNDAMA